MLRKPQAGSRPRPPRPRPQARIGPAPSGPALALGPRLPDHAPPRLAPLHALGHAPPAFSSATPLPGHAPGLLVTPPEPASLPRGLQQVLFPLPTPLPVFALLTAPGSELPSVCIGVSPGRPAKSVLFHTVRFGVLSCWLGEMSTEHKGPVQVTQVEEDMVMVLMDGMSPPPSLPFLGPPLRRPGPDSQEPGAP